MAGAPVMRWVTPRCVGILNSYVGTLAAARLSLVDQELRKLGEGVYLAQGYAAFDFNLTAGGVTRAVLRSTLALTRRPEGWRIAHIIFRRHLPNRPFLSGTRSATSRGWSILTRSRGSAPASRARNSLTRPHGRGGRVRLGRPATQLLTKVQQEKGNSTSWQNSLARWLSSPAPARGSAARRRCCSRGRGPRSCVAEINAAAGEETAHASRRPAARPSPSIPT